MVNFDSKKCEKCFWNVVTIDIWSDFQPTWEREQRETKLLNVKNKKCRLCKEGIEDNFSKIWECKSCKKIIDGHNYYLHAKLCDGCWDKMVDSESNS